MRKTKPGILYEFIHEIVSFMLVYLEIIIKERKISFNRDKNNINESKNIVF